MAIICLLSLLPSISVLANENYITDPATSLRGKSDSAVDFCATISCDERRSSFGTDLEGYR